MTIAALKAGKHVMCTVPMAITVDECRQIVELVRETGLKYMMAETVVYSREYLFARELYRSGRLGRIQFLQGSHHQDMDGWPDGLARVAADVLRDALRCARACAILDGEAETVSCFGSGRIREDLIARYGSPFAVETAHIIAERFGRGRPGLPLSVRRRAPVPRELRCVRQPSVDRVAADRGRRPYPAYRETAAS